MRNRALVWKRSARFCLLSTIPCPFARPSLLLWMPSLLSLPGEPPDISCLRYCVDSHANFSPRHLLCNPRILTKFHFTDDLDKSPPLADVAQWSPRRCSRCNRTWLWAPESALSSIFLTVTGQFVYFPKHQLLDFSLSNHSFTTTVV